MTKKLFARILILAGVVLLLVLFAWEAFSEELSVIEVRRNIPLADEDPIYQDYYINSGTNEGLKVNLVVSVIRKINVRDASGTQSYGDMLVPVGQLKVIYAGEKFAVAREFKLFSRDDQPMLEQTGIMIGDKIETKSSFIDTHKLSGRKPAKLAQKAVEKVSEKITEAPAGPAPVTAAAAATPATTPKPAPKVEKNPPETPADLKAENKDDIKDDLKKETSALDKSESHSDEKNSPTEETPG